MKLHHAAACFLLLSAPLAQANSHAVGCVQPIVRADVVENFDLPTALPEGKRKPDVMLSASSPLSGPYSARRATCTSLRNFNPTSGLTQVACGHARGIVQR